MCVVCIFFFKQKTAYEMRISDWSSDVCSSDLLARRRRVVVIAHYRLKVFKRNGLLENGIRTQEKLVVPMAYAETGEPDAVLVYVDQRFSDIPMPAPTWMRPTARAGAPPAPRRTAEIGSASCRERVCQYV